MMSQNQVAVITGGTRGIGLAIADQLWQDGWSLLLSYHQDDAAATAAAEHFTQSARPGQEVITLIADASTEEGAASLMAMVRFQFGRLDALVNNAGITRDNYSMRMSQADWDAVLETNLRGPFLVSKAAYTIMSRQAWRGRMVNISSIVGLTGNIAQANYASAKAGLIALTKSLAKEYARRGITVNAVAPGYIQTQMTGKLPEEFQQEIKAKTPLKRFGTPADVAGAVAFLVSERASFITGHTLVVDGGLSLG